MSLESTLIMSHAPAMPVPASLDGGSIHLPVDRVLLEGKVGASSSRHLPTSERIHANLRNSAVKVVNSNRIDSRRSKVKSHRFQDVEERSEEQVIKELRRWWKSAKVAFANLNIKGSVTLAITGKTLDGDNRVDFQGIAALQRDEYEMFYKRLVWAFNHDDDDENDLNPDEVLFALEVDWENDSRKKDHVDMLDFDDCVFELADSWVKDEDGDGDIDKDDFLKYLKDLFPRVFDTDNQSIIDWWNSFIYDRASEEVKEKVKEKQLKQKETTTIPCRPLEGKTEESNAEENTTEESNAEENTDGERIEKKGKEQQEIDAERAALAIQRISRGNMTRTILVAKRIGRWKGLRSVMQPSGHWQKTRLKVLAASKLRTTTAAPVILLDGQSAVGGRNTGIEAIPVLAAVKEFDTHKPADINDRAAKVEVTRISAAQKVTISCLDADASVYYTIDGSFPSSISKQYADNTALMLCGGNVSVKAIAIRGGRESKVTEATFIVEKDGEDGESFEFEMEETGGGDESAAPRSPQDMRLVEYASSVPGLSLLSKGLKQAAVADELEKTESLTFFAPTDEAFNKLPPLLLEYLFQPSQKEELKKVLLYHAHAQEEMNAAELTGHETIDTIEGEVIFGASLATVLDQSQTDVQFAGGILQGVNEVLIPSSMARGLEKALATLLDSKNATMLKKLQLKEWADKVVLQTKLRRHSFASAVNAAATSIQKIHRGSRNRWKMGGGSKESGTGYLGGGSDEAQSAQEANKRENGQSKESGTGYLGGSDEATSGREANRWKNGQSNESGTGYLGGSDEAKSAQEANNWKNGQSKESRTGYLGGSDEAKSAQEANNWKNGQSKESRTGYLGGSDEAKSTRENNSWKNPGQSKDSNPGYLGGSDETQSAREANNWKGGGRSKEHGGDYVSDGPYEGSQKQKRQANKHWQAGGKKQDQGYEYASGGPYEETSQGREQHGNSWRAGGRTEQQGYEYISDGPYNDTGRHRSGTDMNKSGQESGGKSSSQGGRHRNSVQQSVGRIANSNTGQADLHGSRPSCDRSDGQEHPQNDKRYDSFQYNSGYGENVVLKEARPRNQRKEGHSSRKGSRPVSFPQVSSQHTPSTSILDERGKANQREWMANSLTPHRPARSPMSSKSRGSLRRSYGLKPLLKQQSQSARERYKYVSSASTGNRSFLPTVHKASLQVNSEEQLHSTDDDTYDLRYSCSQRTIYRRTAAYENNA